MSTDLEDNIYFIAFNLIFFKTASLLNSFYLPVVASVSGISVTVVDPQ